jgi:hypothetical protein
VCGSRPLGLGLAQPHAIEKKWLRSQLEASKIVVFTRDNNTRSCQEDPRAAPFRQPLPEELPWHPVWSPRRRSLAPSNVAV